MKQQYISPKAEVEVLCVEHYLQTESITEVVGGNEGDPGYTGPGSGGGRGKEREEDTWGDLW